MNSEKPPRCKKMANLKIWAFIFSALLLLTNVSAQDKCDNALEEASQKIRRGQFDDVIQLLLRCQPELADLNDKLEGLRLLGRAYAGLNYYERAKKTIYQLLELAPDWEPDPLRNPQLFLQIVDRVKQQKLEEEEKTRQEAQKGESKGGKKKWFFILGGGAAAAVLTVALVSGGGGEKRLPGPPQFP